MAAEKEWERKSHALLFYWRKQKAAARCDMLELADFSAAALFINSVIRN